jgi:hypothetical protein
MQQIISPEYKDILSSYRKLQEGDDVDEFDGEEMDDEARETEKTDLVKRADKLDERLRQLVTDAEEILSELDEIAKQATDDGLFDEKAESQVKKALNSVNRQIPSLNKNFELAKLTISRALK